MITGAIWAGIWWKFFVVSGPNADWVRGCFYMAASATLVSIIFIDWELYIIPDQINAFLLFLAAVFHAYKGTWADFFWGWFAGWGILFGIALLGRLILQKDSMGHADIKMMRGIGALIGVQMLLANMVVAVFSGLIIGIVGVVVTLIQKSRNPDKAEDPYQPPPPESVKDLIVLGGTYLIALDIPAIWFPQIYEKLGYQMQPENIEEDDWQPSLMTIPFGPYLALGAIICMLFSDGIINVWQNYWRKMTEPSQISIIVSEASFPTGNGRDMSFRWDVRSSSGLSSLVSPDYRNPERDARVERVGRRIGKQI